MILPYADIPANGPARLCAVREVERQAAFMTLRGWPVEMPIVRVVRGQEVLGGVFVVGNPLEADITVMEGATFERQERWHLLLPKSTERALCGAETAARAGRRVHAREEVETVYHELSHQFYADEAGADWRARRLTARYLRSLR